MKHIIISFNMFTKEQNIYVYVDGACVKEAKAETDKIVDTVDALRKEYDVNQIDLYGNEDYLTHFKSCFYTKYEDVDNLEVNIIGRE